MAVARDIPHHARLGTLRAKLRRSKAWSGLLKIDERAMYDEKSTAVEPSDKRAVKKDGMLGYD